MLRKLRWIGLFAVAMAYVESATVMYICRIYGISDLVLNIPPFDSTIASIEVGREFATLVMLMAVGWAAGKSLQSRISFTFLIFGVWDIFYYIWLRLFIGWPDSLLSTDILFLIPLPWWGPVLAPILVACLMILAGIFTLIREDQGGKIHFSKLDWITSISGVLIMLYSFMKDSLAIMPADADTLAQLRPSGFSWPIYILGLVITGYGVLHATWPHKQKQSL